MRRGAIDSIASLIDHLDDVITLEAGARLEDFSERFHRTSEHLPLTMKNCLDHTGRTKVIRHSWRIDRLEAGFQQRRQSIEICDGAAVESGFELLWNPFDWVQFRSVCLKIPPLERVSEDSFDGGFVDELGSTVATGELSRILRVNRLGVTSFANRGVS